MRTSKFTSILAGGDVYAGSEIYTALRSYRLRESEVVKIVGIAASAASVIANGW